MLDQDMYMLEGAWANNPLAHLACFWSAFEFVVCMIGLADWLRHARNQNKIHCTSHKYTTHS